MTARHATRRSRRGLTKFELLSCLVAVGGGVWIGAQYVGLNLEGVAYQALDESDLLTQIPDQWRPANPECPDGDCPSPEETRRLEEAQLRDELEQIRQQVTGLEWSGNPANAPTPTTDSLTPELQTTREKTLAYWNGLARVVADVNTIQERVAPLAETGSHGQALALRQQALQYGVKAVALLDPEGVDAQAVATGVRVTEWFSYGSSTLTTALELRSHQPVAGRAASAAEVWAQTEGELKQRTELVRRKSQETSAYLSSRYLSGFAPLGL